MLEPDPETYPLVEEARRLHNQGRTIRNICKVMAETGLRSKEWQGDRAFKHAVGPGVLGYQQQTEIAHVDVSVDPRA